MNKLLQLLLLMLLPLSTIQAVESVHLQEADIDLEDSESLQRGAKYYVQYCLGCHSSKHIRYIRMAHHFDISFEKTLEEIAPEGAGIYDTLITAMNKHDATKWFGTEPPDLSLIARSRGQDWLYSYLKGFYLDPKKSLGVNNTVFKDVGMPNVLWKLQGLQRAEFETVNGQEVISELVIDEEGTMNEEEFDLMVNDLVNFLVYIGEPTRLERESMGKYVLFFLFMFLILAYLLKKEYWKDIH